MSFWVCANCGLLVFLDTGDGLDEFFDHDCKAGGG